MENLIRIAFFLVLVFAPRKGGDDFESLCAFEYINPEPVSSSINSREDWDDNVRLLAQYQKLLGESIRYIVLEKERKRIVGDISYLDAFGICEDGLDFVYRGGSIVIHHTEFFRKGDVCEQSWFIRDGQIVAKRYKFNDCAYHFAIGEDEAITELRPLTHMGTHAGKLKECRASKRLIIELPEKVGEEYWRKLDEIVELMKIDPDFGAIGIVLIGNYNLEAPSQETLIALMDLVIWLMYKFDIPLENIKLHEGIRHSMTEAGYTPTGSPKTCPGYYFPDEKCVQEMTLGRMKELHYIADWY